MTRAHNIPVLMYHHVNASPSSLTVTADNFEQQIKALAENGYQSVGSHELAAFFSGQPLDKKSVVITFDDGYLDNWVYAHPVLERYGFKAILFVVSGLIGEGDVRPYLGQGLQPPHCPNHHDAKTQMFGPDPDQVMLRWSEIEAMLSANTFEIHSHTHTHTRWDKVCNNPQDKFNKFYDDLEKSRETLDARIGQTSSHLCWPQGYFDDDYLQAARQLGFKHFYTTDARGQNTASSNPEYIYRFAVRNRRGNWLRQRIWLASHRYWGPLYNNWKTRSDDKKRK